MSEFRYSRYTDGPDPLAPPYDVAGALDAVGDSVLAGSSAQQALRDLLQRGDRDFRGLGDLRRQIRDRMNEVRARGQLDGTLGQVRELLDEALAQERAALFRDPADDARLREVELDTLPTETARAVRDLADYRWTSDQAQRSYDAITDLLRREVLDQQFRGMKSALSNEDPEQAQRIRDMVAELTGLLEAAERGEDTRKPFTDFMAKYGDFFPDQPANLDELIESLARRAAAADRLRRSLTPEQRDELDALSEQAFQNLGIADAMGRLDAALRRQRPELFGNRNRPRMGGDEGLGLGDATTALEDLANLEDLDRSLAQTYPGASLEDIDEEAIRAALGRAAVDDLEKLRQLERELERQGYLVRNTGALSLSPKAVRRIADTALRRVFASLSTRASGDHDHRDAGGAGDPTGATRAWTFGDEQPIDVVRTVSNALRRGTGNVRLAVEDFEVVETERRTQAVVCLLLDLSYSMVLNDTWAAAKTTALALHALISGQFPQDSLHIIGFSDYARVLQPDAIAELEGEMVQGTNLQHALMLAGRFIDRHPAADPVVLIVTDGEPTAHLLPDGEAWFDWPPAPETLTLTLAEVDRMTRRGATLNLFMLGDEPRLIEFVNEVAARNGGRVLTPAADRLDDFVVRDFLRARKGLGRSRSA